MRFKVLILVLLATLAEVLQLKADDVGRFGYQGYLMDGNTPANGTYNLRFTIFDGPAGTTELQSDGIPNVLVKDGIFSVTLDVTNRNAFNGDPRWLEIAILPRAEVPQGAVLSPRQPILPTPYALFALDARNSIYAASAGSVAWKDITGVPPIPPSFIYEAGSGLQLVLGPGADTKTLSIAALGVTTPMLANGAVTLSKINTSGANAGQILVFDGAIAGWKDPVVIPGNKGDPGAMGAAGPAGPQGAKGDKGDKGDPGVAGLLGAKGDKGEPGASGATGATGPTGAKGDKGDPGAAGPTGPGGPQGGKGDKGDPGVAGPPGSTGSIGPMGAKGDKGDAGATGSAGAAGPQGPKGEKGDPGTPGATGGMGPPGSPGSADAWSRIGNAGTNPGQNFIGTTDNQALELRANNQTALRLAPGGSLGTVLEIKGSLRVPAAGIGSGGPAFIHRAIKGVNISGHLTTIDHSLCNGDANAILIITQNWNPGGAGGTYNSHPVGVFYDGARWCIFNQDFAELPDQAAFNLLVFKP